MQRPPPGKKKSPVSSVGPTDRRGNFFLCVRSTFTTVSILGWQFFTTGSLGVWIADWGSWYVKTMLEQQDPIATVTTLVGQTVSLLVSITTVSTTASTEMQSNGQDSKLRLSAREANILH